MSKLFYVVTYDIVCDKRRKKVANLLEGYGRRVQYSVFECELSSSQLKELKERLQPRMKVSEDSLRIYPLSSHTIAKIEIWGGVPKYEPPGSTII